MSSLSRVETDSVYQPCGSMRAQSAGHRSACVPVVRSADPSQGGGVIPAGPSGESGSRARRTCAQYSPHRRTSPPQAPTIARVTGRVGWFSPRMASLTVVLPYPVRRAS